MGAGRGGGGRVCGVGMEYILGYGIGGREWGAGIEYIPLWRIGEERRGTAIQENLTTVSFIVH